MESQNKASCLKCVIAVEVDYDTSFNKSAYFYDYSTYIYGNINVS